MYNFACNFNGCLILRAIHSDSCGINIAVGVYNCLEYRYDCRNGQNLDHRHQARWN